MKKSVESQAATVELAVEKALEELGAKRDQVDVEVLDKGGLFSKASVVVTLKENLGEKLCEFINGALERMMLNVKAEVREENDTIYINIDGEDTKAVIGHRGETLDAFQYLALTFLNEHKAEYKKVVVDSANYRERRKQTLSELALRLAAKAVRLRRKIELEPMNPFERRAVHSALADSELARTESEGEDEQRHVIIIPLNVELVSDTPIKDGGRDDKKGRGDRFRDGRKSRRGDRGDRRKGRGDSRPRAREEEEEVEDGNVYRYFTEQDDFVKPAPQAAPPKFKSFGGKKRF